METIIPASTKRDTQLFLLSLGGSPRRQGFLFLGQCIDIIAEHEELRRCLYKQVYAAVARPYARPPAGWTPPSGERSPACGSSSGRRSWRSLALMVIVPPPPASSSLPRRFI